MDRDNDTELRVWQEVARDMATRLGVASYELEAAVEAKRKWVQDPVKRAASARGPVFRTTEEGKP